MARSRGGEAGGHAAHLAWAACSAGDLAAVLNTLLGVPQACHYLSKRSSSCATDAAVWPGCRGVPGLVGAALIASPATLEMSAAVEEPVTSASVMIGALPPVFPLLSIAMADPPSGSRDTLGSLWFSELKAVMLWVLRAVPMQSRLAGHFDCMH